MTLQLANAEFFLPALIMNRHASRIFTQGQAKGILGWLCWKVHLVLGFRQCVGMIRADSMAPGDVASGNTMLGQAVYKPLFPTLR